MKFNTELILAVMGGLSADYKGFGVKRKREKKEKPCLNCGTLHLHNNSFCSAECCKEYRK